MVTAPRLAPPASLPAPSSKSNASKTAKGRQDGSELPANSPLFRGAKEGFDSLESKKDDMKAATYFEEFKLELQGWWHSGSNQSRRQEIEARGDFADYLTDKYMCKKLDPLPPSKIISSVRKDISRILEEFAGAGMLPTNFTDTVFEIVSDDKQLARSVRDATDSAAEIRLKTRMREMEMEMEEVDVNVESDDDDGDNRASNIASASNYKASTADASSTSSSSSSVKSSKKIGADPAAKLISEEKERKVYDAVQAEAARKKELEKMKVRQQYEAYMKLKSNSEIKYDVEKAKEYEELNSDIRSLISSIGQVQDNATNLKTKKVL